LRRARKAQDRRRKESQAAENRVLFGTSKAERLAVEAERTKAARDLEAHRIEPPPDRPPR
jgi:hypothetical protein